MAQQIGINRLNLQYKGKRFTTADHRETIKTNGWDFCPVDIMDEDGAVMIPVKGGKHFKEMSVGKHLLNYNSLVVLTHFKGHASGGYGGSLKNIAIGCADGTIGKKMIHMAMRGQSSTTESSERFHEKVLPHRSLFGLPSLAHPGRRLVSVPRSTTILSGPDQALTPKCRPKSVCDR